VSTSEAIKAKMLAVTGDRKAAQHFLSFFSFDEPRLRQLEHV
jgi:hypothetical protein